MESIKRYKRFPKNVPNFIRKHSSHNSHRTTGPRKYMKAVSFQSLPEVHVLTIFHGAVRLRQRAYEAHVPMCVASTYISVAR